MAIQLAAQGVKLLPLLAKGAAGLGIGTLGLGTGASLVSGGLKATGLEKQLGLDETTLGRKRRFDRTEQDGYKLQSTAPEKFFDFFMGKDTNKIREAAQKKSNKYIEDEMLARKKNVKQLTGVMGEMFGLDSDLIPKLRDNQSIDSYESDIVRAENLVNRGLDIQQQEPGIDLTGLNEAGLNREYSRLTEERANKKEAKKDGLLAMQNALDNRRYDIQDSRDARQSSYDNRVLDMTSAREARNARDKQMMMLIQGLNAFGQGFQ
jgi:hypothetical protein